MTSPPLDAAGTGDSAKEPADDRPSLVGSLISGRYRIEEALGEGGMGSVYLAEHTLMHKRMAIKVLHPEMTRLPEVVARFEREAMAAAHIEHPNVAAATDFGQLDDGSFFLVLEFVQGKSLRELLDAGPLPPQRAIHITSQIVSALVRAHGLGIVHRDLKPENVMLVDRDGDPDFVKVLDFGIAKVPVGEIVKSAPITSKQALTQLGIVYGTPEYMAPEQALGRAVDARADLYSLGVLLYEMLTGVRPFEAENPVTLLGLHVTQAVPSFRDRAPNLSVPPELEAIVMALLEKEAEKRPKDAREVLEALEQLKLLLRYSSSPGSEIAMTLRTPLRAVSPPLGTGNDVHMMEQLRPVTRVFKDSAVLLKTWAQPAAARAWIEASRRLPGLQRRVESLHRRLPPKLAVIPPLGWLGGFVLAFGFAALLGLVVLCAPAKPLKMQSAFRPVAVEGMANPTAPNVPVLALRATETELREAAAGGPEAVRKLAERYPRDPKTLKLAGKVYTEAGQADKALAAYRDLMAIDLAAVNDNEVGQNVVVAAQLEGTSDAAFAMLESDMGPRGIDLLYWLGYESKAQPKSTARAVKTLARKEVYQRGSAALQVAVDLRNAAGCEAKHKLLERAAKDGDARTLRQLQPLLVIKGCGFLALADCWKCMRKNALLSNTIKAIESRAADRARE